VDSIIDNCRGVVPFFADVLEASAEIGLGVVPFGVRFTDTL